MPESSANLPLVSVVTPSFNRRGFIEQCLCSVAAQDYPNVEHIVIDGGSSDGTAELLASWDKTPQFRWVSERDRGMYDAINKGLRMSRGEILCYLNTDDMYLPWSVSTAVEGLRGGHDVVYGDLIVIKERDGQEINYVQFYPPFEFGHYLWVQSIGQPTVFWKRSVSDSVGLFADTSYRLIADCDRWMSFAAAGFTPVKLDEVLAVQIDHEETLRETHAELLQTEFAALREQYGGLCKRSGSSSGRLGAKLDWRLNNFALLHSLRSASPVRWPRFSGFVRSASIPVRASYAWFGLLPGFMRFGTGTTLLDSRSLLAALGCSVVEERSDRVG